MPLKFRHARIPAAIAILALAAFAILWLAARSELARGRVAALIADVAGQPTSIERMHIGLLPTPSLEIGGLAIAQPPGYGNEPILSVGRLRLEIPWASIFDPSDVDSIEISDATARLVASADGVGNWSKLGTATPAGSDAARQEAADWSIGALDLERGAVDYRDAATGSHWQLTAITLGLKDLAPRAEFPLELSFGGIFHPNTIHFAMKGRGRIDTDAGRYEASALDFRGWAGGEPLPLRGAELTGALARASYETASGIAILAGGRFNLAGMPASFDGRLDFGNPSLVAAVNVKTEPFAPRGPAIILGHPLPATADPAAFESLQLAAEIVMQEGQLRLDPVTGRLDDTNFSARIRPADRFVRA
ncbi:MAG: AsmA family protein, partial [Steroidobacteraceae bacterium]